MKAYTATEFGSQAGIHTKDNTILVGEGGRGRKCVEVPLPDKNLCHYANERIEKKVILLNASGKQINSRSGIEAEPWVKNHAQGEVEKNGGSLKWEQIVYADLISYQSNTPEDEILVLFPDFSGFRGQSTVQTDNLCKVVAKGRCAAGIAGNMGGGDVVLVRMKNNAKVIVNRSGRRIDWKSAEYTNKGGTLIFCDPEKEKETSEAAQALM